MERLLRTNLMYLRDTRGMTTMLPSTRTSLIPGRCALLFLGEPSEMELVCLQLACAWLPAWSTAFVRVRGDRGPWLGRLQYRIDRVLGLVSLRDHRCAPSFPVH